GDRVEHAAECGVVTGSVAVDMTKVRQRKREMVEGLIAVHLDLYRQSGAELIMGDGRFVAPKTLEVRLRDGGGTRVLKGERVFLNVGTRATIPPIAGLADARPLTYIEALELDRLPAHLIVLGGGYVGLELARPRRCLSSWPEWRCPPPFVAGPRTTGCSSCSRTQKNMRTAGVRLRADSWHRQKTVQKEIHMKTDTVARASGSETKTVNRKTHKQEGKLMLFENQTSSNPMAKKTFTQGYN